MTSSNSIDYVVYSIHVFASRSMCQVFFYSMQPYGWEHTYFVRFFPQFRCLLNTYGVLIAYSYIVEVPKQVSVYRSRYKR